MATAGAREDTETFLDVGMTLEDTTAMQERKWDRIRGTRRRYGPEQGPATSVAS